MRRTLLAAAFCLAGGQLAQAATLGPKDGQGLAPVAHERVATGSPAPDFTLERSDGALVTLSDFRDERSVILVFYRGYW